MIVKVKVTAAEYDELSEEFKAAYKQKGEEWFLQTDESGRLERALKSERQGHEQTTKLLAQVVPSIVDADSNSGFVPRSDWKRLVHDRVDLLDELGDDFDLDDYRRFRDDPEGEARDDDKVKGELLEAQKEVRQLKRDLSRVERERDEFSESLTATRDREQTLVIDRDVNAVLDTINVRDPFRRRMAKAMFSQYLKMRVEDGVTMVTTEDGKEMTLEEFGPDWAGTDDGKEFVSAPDNSGGRSSDTSTRRVRSSSEGEKRTGRQKLAAGLAAQRS